MPSSIVCCQLLSMVKCHVAEIWFCINKTTQRTLHLSHLLQLLVEKWDSKIANCNTLQSNQSFYFVNYCAYRHEIGHDTYERLQNK